MAIDTTHTGGDAVPREAGAPARVRSKRRGVVVAAVLAAGAGTLALRDPNISGSYGYCPFRAITGIDCPFCGGLRGTHALLQGDVSAALDYNVLLPVLLGAGLVGLMVWWRGSFLGVTGQHLTSKWAVLTAISVLLVFWVLRNLPVFPYLSSSQ